MKNRTAILLLFFMFHAHTSFAADCEKSLIVLMKSGTMVTLSISEQPRIQFDGTVMHIGDGDYQIENVRKWMIGDPDEIAQGVEEARRDNAIVYKNGVLTVGSRADVHVWNSAGMEMSVRLRNGQVDMTAWPQDVYVIKVGNETLKLRRR